MKKFERVKAVVSLDAIAHNFAEMKKNIAKGTKIVAVIKADGYGHGAEAIARLIEDYDYIWGFAVATPEEALQLRTFGVKKPILILGIVFEEYFTQMIAKEIRLTVCTYEMAQKLSEEAQRQGRDVHIHIGLDTVTLKGEPFTPHVVAGDKVKQGDLLMEVDLDKIQAAGLNTITPVLICNTDTYGKIALQKKGEVTLEDAVLKLS